MGTTQAGSQPALTEVFSGKQPLSTHCGVPGGRWHRAAAPTLGILPQGLCRLARGDVSGWRVLGPQPSVPKLTSPGTRLP